jgi:hypothetical protein
VQAVTAQNTLTGAQGQVGYNISFTKPVQTLSASELQALVTGNVQANIVSVTQVNATTWQAVLSVQGTGTVTLGFVDSTIKDIAGTRCQARRPAFRCIRSRLLLPCDAGNAVYRIASGAG